MPDRVSLHRQTFRKEERLCSRKIISEVATKGKNINAGPIRLSWLPAPLSDGFAAQAAFAVPKRNFKQATDRNRIRRRLREAYRKNKSAFYTLISPYKTQYALLFVFTGKEIITYQEAEKKIVEILNNLARSIQKNNS